METKLIVWDEAPMMNRFWFESFDHTLRDLMRFQCVDIFDKPFGGKILPAIRNGSGEDVVIATINSSNIWRSCKVLRLTHNMRLSTAKTNECENEIKEFANWILKIGDGDMDSNENGEGNIDILDDLLITHSDKPLLSLVDFVYPDILQNMKTNRPILAPTLEAGQQVNEFILSLIPGDEKQYLSYDAPCDSDEDA
ncbi:hypothetical protein CR513_38920, partial [Mucuna pruriens]